MSVDRGGLNYTIRVENEFSTGIDAFRQQTQAAKRDWRGLKDELAKGARVNVANTPQDRQALRDQTRETLRLARAERIRTQALREYNAETRREAINQAKADVAQAQRFANERRQLTQLQRLQEAEKRVTKVLNERDRLERTFQAVQARGISLTEQEALKLGLAEKISIRKAQATQRLSKAEADLNRVLAARTLLQERAEAVARRGVQLSPEEAISLGLASPIRQPTGTQAKTAIPKSTAADLDAVAASAKRADTVLNRISFTFRRLFGILAAFAAARFAVQSFVGLLRQMVTFNAEVEQAELGIAAIVTATGGIRDALGQAVPKAQQLALAQAEARKQTALLRKDALQTTATFEELVETFQVAVAPGLTAGLDLNEIRRLSVRISQAAAAIGLPQNQLPEEIRSLLSGTIQQRTTRIAVALGITNDDIRRAKEAGTLVEFLNDRFSAFAVAGEESLGTFNTLLSNVRDGILQIVGAGGLEFFNEVKGLLGDIQNIIVNTSPLSDVVELNPNVVLVARRIADGLQVAARAARQLIANLRVQDIENIGEAVGDAIAIASQQIVSATDGFIRAGGDIALVITTATDAIQAATGAELVDTDNLNEVTSLVARILTILAAIALTTRAVSGSLSVGSRLLTPIVAVVGLLSAKVLLTAAAIAAVVVGVGAVVQATLNWFDAGISVADILREIATVVTDKVNATFEVANDLLDAISDKANALKEFFGAGSGNNGVQRQAIDLNAEFDSINANVGSINEGLDNQGKLIENLRRKAVQAREALAFEVANINVSGPVLEQRRALFEAEAEAREETRTLTSEIVTKTKERLNIVNRIAQAEQQIASLPERTRNIIQGGGDIQVENSLIGRLRERLRLTNEVAKAQTQVSLAQQEVLAAERENDAPAAEAALVRQRQAEEQLSVAQDLLDRNTANNNALAEGGLITEDMVAAARQLVEFKGREAAISAQIVEMSQRKFEVENRLLEIAASQISAQATRTRTDVLNEIEVLKAETEALAALEAIDDTERQRRDRAEAEGSLSVRQAELRVLESQRQAEQDALQTQIDSLNTKREQLRLQEQILLTLEQTPAVQQQVTDLQRQQGAVGEAIAESESLKGDLLERNALLRQQELLLLENIAEEADKARRREEEPITFGLLEGLREAARQAPTIFEGIRDTVVNGVESMASTISGLIVDAFDPTADIDIKERFGRFLQDISRQIIQTFVQVAIARAALNLASGGVFGVFGFAEGGAVPAVGLASGGPVIKPRGFAKGGMPRPKGLPPSDTVGPIWATPGEYMVREPVVSSVGLEFFNLLNAGAFEPSQLRFMARAKRGHRTRNAPLRRGFAEGGQIPGRLASATAPAPGGSTTTVLPVFAVTETEADRIVRSGRNAILELLETSEAKARLNKR